MEAGARDASQSDPLRNAAGDGGRAGAGSRSRKRADPPGAAADMCRMSFKVSSAGSGRQCRAGPQTRGGRACAQGRGRGARWWAGRRPGCRRRTGGSYRAGTAPVVCGLVMWALLERLLMLMAAGLVSLAAVPRAAGTVAEVTFGAGEGEEVLGHRFPLSGRIRDPVSSFLLPPYQSTFLDTEAE